MHNPNAAIVMQKNYLFLYLKTGGGHQAPARSIANYIHAKFGDKASVTLFDGFTGVNKWVKTIIEDGYRKSQDTVLGLFELLYAFHKLSFVASITAIIISWFVKPQLEKFILKKSPDHIVIFHFFLIRPVIEIVKRNKLDIPVLVVVTDPFTAHPIWFLDKRPRFVVFSQKLKNYAMQSGINEKVIKVFPFILDEKFTRPLSPVLSRSMKQSLGFDPDKRLILILGGGDGIPKGKKILENFIRKNNDVQVAIVCGKNKALHKKAWQLKEKHSFDSLRIFGYVDFVYELINIADIVVTKCGASTFMEILISGKIPVINNYIWEQEKGNVQFVCENKLGIYEKDVTKLPERVDEIITDPKLYNSIKNNIEKQKLVNGTPMVSEFLVTESLLYE